MTNEVPCTCGELSLVNPTPEQMAEATKRGARFDDTLHRWDGFPCESSEDE